MEDWNTCKEITVFDSCTEMSLEILALDSLLQGTGTVFEYRLLRGIFGHKEKRKEVKNLHNYERYNFYCPGV